ncbi:MULTISPECIES: low temperature requirement protein A [Bacillus]|uniref:Low temperature requirement protein A n=1 Tax=Bacillus paranthracis TaxID=2026186 RepID=A0AAX3Q7D2_9BACI|nr:MULTISPECIES: low temperature requirement protein A [Bacillus]EEK44173.1 Low temperature requirement protein A [Bacillus cereus m1293]MBL3845076.1 low temperature requirement protein A [Bacillus cereus]MCU4849577.1 low temperature requirement protein A [Bacillus paranthracis]MCU5208270.1 low temperature requirement protein A [Bacillus paranthracis]MDA1588380.1 low temperature requirement protein A [Bacillus cereus group sp. TH225LC]
MLKTEEKKVTWLELFYDLLFVAAVATATEVLHHTEKGYIHPEYILKFILIFIPIWWAWTGQTMFINRFGQDFLHQRIFMILQMVFVLIMISSLSVNFDQYYHSFLIGYIGLRVLTAIQYLVVVKLEKGYEKKVAWYLGTHFWIGITISFTSIFFESWIRYVVLYAGILFDIIVPFWGRKYLVKAPINTAHLLERFALLTLILFGESVVSTLAVLQPQKGDWHSILFSIVSFILIISMWWQYFDNVEKKVDKSIKTAGQSIIYGHLFILMSLSMIAVSIKLLFLNEVHYSFILYLVFGSVLLYFFATSIVFHQYRYKQNRLTFYHLWLFLGILAMFFIFNLIVPTPSIVIIGELTLFFIIYAKVTTT